MNLKYFEHFWKLWHQNMWLFGILAIDLVVKCEFVNRSVLEQCPFPFPEVILIFHINRKGALIDNSALFCFVAKEAFFANRETH